MFAAGSEVTTATRGPSNCSVSGFNQTLLEARELLRSKNVAVVD